jgi:phosphate transport system substrate-binding protein
LAVAGGLSLASCGGGANTVKLQGAGATFPAPLYEKWFKNFGETRPNVEVDYQSVGSGTGVKNFIDKTVDFGASDAAMTAEEMARVDPARGVQCLPMTAGSIVISYNLPDVKELKLSRKAYSGIFLGTVKRWNDPLIAKDNPGVKLPDAPINVVVRSDSSGTTFVFTQHLSAISPDFASGPGTNKMPNWPVGTRSKGNEGVTASVKTTPGAVGYIEYGYAKSQNMPMATLENKSGAWIVPSTASGQAALNSVQLPDNLIAWVPDPQPADAYPIVTYTWMLVNKKYDNARLPVMQDLLRYGVTEGQKDAEPLGYIPLPQAVVDKVKSAVDTMSAT